MPDKPMNPPRLRPTDPTSRRQHLNRTRLERMTETHLAALRGTMADTVGPSNRQRLVWLGMLSMPLLFPVALPGMASVVGAFCLFIAAGLCLGRPVPLPRWLGEREIPERVAALIRRVVAGGIRHIGRIGRPRLLPLSDRSNRWTNSAVLSTAGLSMMVPVPLISFDNVLPALAIGLIAWGLRLRDGWMLIAGYAATAVALLSVVLLWWGGAHAVSGVTEWLWGAGRG